MATLTPKEQALKRTLAQLSPNEARTMTETVESRIRAQATKPTTPRKPSTAAQRRLRVLQRQLQKSGDWDKMSKQAQKAWRAAKLVDLNKPVKAVTDATSKVSKIANAAKKTTDATSKASRAARAGQATANALQGGAKVLQKTGETAAKTISALSKGAGVVAGGAKVLGKYVAPVAAVGEAINVAKLITSDEARKEAKDYATGMEDDGVLKRVGKSLWSPTDTIYGAGALAKDALDSFGSASDSYVRRKAFEKEKAPLIAAENARRLLRDKSLAGGLSEEQKDQLRKRARPMSGLTAEERQPQRDLMKAYRDVSSPEEARALYNKTFPTDAGGVSQPTRASELEPSAPEMTLDEIEAADIKAGAMEDNMTLQDYGEEDMQASEDEAYEPDEPDETVGDYSDQALGLFKNTHGTGFDPKSSKDRGKLKKMKDILAAQGGLGDMSPNQFALNLYRSQ